ncbi:vWA domain-containing protein [Litchfieldia alkalitelluris]|uniref:vWA domain-containing protein n=1 Tax=Litchfieldia alkalitelluris TaxID=304268 RepID=UPI0009987B43|nr:VWA domain-containing protein [Litchfieldia alkalitelluris]
MTHQMTLMERMNRKELKEAGIRNKGHKLPLMLVLDTSGSMLHNNNIDKLNRGVQSFYNEILEDPIVREHLHVSLVTFGEGGVQVATDFGNPAEQEIPVLKAGGSSPLCTAIMTGLDLLEDQIDIYNNFGITSHPPVMIILTDGEPTTMEYDERGVPILVTKDTPEFLVTKKRFNYFHTAMRLSSYSIFFGDDVENTYFLHQFATAKSNVQKLDEVNIIKFFKMLGKSSSALTKAIPGTGFSLDMSFNIFEEIAENKKK